MEIGIMEDFSTFEWAVVAPLFVIMCCTIASAFGIDRSLEKMTRRLESALGEIRLQTEEVKSEIQTLRELIIFRDTNGDFD